MGSVISVETCPNCGREAFNTDYYYRSDEEYCFCTFCGFTRNQYIKRLRRNKRRSHVVKSKYLYDIKDMYFATAVFDESKESYRLVEEISINTSINEIKAFLNEKTEKTFHNVLCKKRDDHIERICCYSGNIEKKGKWLIVRSPYYINESYGGSGVIGFEHDGIGSYQPMKDNWYGNVDLSDKYIVFATAMIDGKLKIVKGLDNPRYMVFRKLKGSDDEQVRIMDQDSGFYVSQWLDDLSDNEEAEHCFGMFTDEEELVSYMSAGYADDIDDIKDYPGYSSDSILLSDVYVKKEYRHKQIGSYMIENYLWSDSTVRDEHIFLTYLYDELQGFYEKFGFTKVEGTDNIMVLPKIEYEKYSNSQISDESDDKLPFI